ncbi:MAG TPA: small multi-drug export protein [Symbiobacteriaceae bacterium]|nr:small multi-drug export protein [Symbiobacteriaceae bacterium]
MHNPLFDLLSTFLISMVPLLELRAGIPLGVAMGLPTAAATAAAILGNLTQVPIARWMVDLAYRFASRLAVADRWLKKTEAQTSRYASWIQRWGWVGLTVFVLLPLPGTGVWGGVVLSRLLGLGAGSIWLGLGLGVAISGAIFGLGTHGALAVFEGWILR